MKIEKIVEGLDSAKLFNLNKDSKVSGIVDDSRKIKQNFLFVAKKGKKFNGINFIEDALKKGAAGVVCEEEIRGIPLVKVESIEKFEKIGLNNFYGDIFNKLKFVGVTGTKGKTTTSFLAYYFLLKRGIAVCYIGTIGIYDRYRNKKRNILTTPDIYELYEILSEFESSGHTCCILEVSSHSLDQKRISGIKFDIAGFTNLSHDHLDYHENMQKYFETKKKLFDKERTKKALINADDDYGKKLLQDIDIPYVSFGQKKGDITFSFKKKKNKGYKINLSNGGKIENNLDGVFNVYNSVMACLFVRELGFDLKKFNFDIKNIPGRMESVKRQGITVYIDYAHSPASLEKVLEELNRKKKKAIITVFGCTGDRDKKKRPIMGEIAESYSDYVFVTSDDPHSEDPLKICRDIEKGFKYSENYCIEPDRKKAIRRSLEVAKKGDIVLIAGKGHEKFQIFDGYEIEFNDKEFVLDYFNNKKI